MLDRRCRHKIRETRDFYLFVKYRTSGIYYVKYVDSGLVKSTGCTSIREAYKKACMMTDAHGNFRDRLALKYKDNKKRQTDLRRVLSFLSDVRSEYQFTHARIRKLQLDMLATGMSGKSVNNYISILKGVCPDFPNVPPVPHQKELRKCFPIKKFYSFYEKVGNDRLLNLAFVAMTTGMRKGELYSCASLEEDGKLYLYVNGTKTENAKRRIPVLKETLEALEKIKGGFASARYKESVVKSAEIMGIDRSFIDENNIVFHSFRKMYKTALESAEIPNIWIEYYMGHSIESSSNVNRLYFIPEAADDDIVYRKTIETLRKFV